MAALIGLPFTAGFAAAFMRSQSRKRLLWLLSFLPLILFWSYALVRSGISISLSEAFIAGVSFAVPVLFIMVGRVFGRPFAEILREKQKERIGRTFE